MKKSLSNVKRDLFIMRLEEALYLHTTKADLAIDGSTIFTWGDSTIIVGTESLSVVYKGMVYFFKYDDVGSVDIDNESLTVYRNDGTYLGFMLGEIYSEYLTRNETVVR